MSWIEDMAKNTVYIYKFEDGETVTGRAKDLEELTGSPVKGEPGEVITIDGREARYGGFKPNELRQTSVVEFEKNGRKAVAVRNKDGSMQYISKTRMHYQQTGEVKNQFTDAHNEAIEKSVQKELQGMEFQKKQKNYDPMAEAIKKLGDGEYVSDGVNFIHADQYEETIKSANQKKG